MNVANQGFPNFRTDLNNALVALVSNSSGATEPTTKFAYQWWLDTSTTPTTLKIRNTANDTWITAMYLNQSTNLMTLAVGAGATGTPSYSTIGDLNTGIWFPAADTVALSTNGTERWRTDSSGTFTVGGISSANRKFEVNLNGQTTISYGDNSLTTNLTLDNLSTSATTNHGSGMIWRVCTDSSATAINSGRIAVIKEQLWTSTASTQDSAMVFYTTLDGSLGERIRISSAGSLGISASSLTGYSLRITKNITGAVSGFGIVNDGQIQSDVTTQAFGFRSALAVQNAAFTLPNLYHVSVEQGTYGASATVTNQYGVIVSSLTGATNNYGFYGNIAAGTNRWNFYAAGTAANYFNGTVTVGTTDAAAATGAGVKLINAESGVANRARLSIVTAESTGSYTGLSLYSTGAGAYRFYVDDDGSGYITNTTWNAISDARLKENVRDIPYGLNEIAVIKPRMYDWKPGKGQDKKDCIGFIAQELQQIFPDFVKESKDVDENGDPYLTVGAADLIPVLVKAIQQLNTRLTNLEAL